MEEGSSSRGARRKDKQKEEYTPEKKTVVLKYEEPIKFPCFQGTDLEVFPCEIDIGKGLHDKAHMLQVEQNRHWFRVMETLGQGHRNVLMAHKIIDKENVPKLFVERFSGVLSHYLITNTQSFINSKTKSVPSVILSQITRQYIDGLDYLHKSGSYHGGSCLKEDFYSIEHGACAVKMANLKEKGGSLPQKKVQDWHELGKALENLSTWIQAYNPGVFCKPIDELSKFFEGVTHDKLRNVKEIALRSMYFMTPEIRIDFMKQELPILLKKSSFQSRVLSAWRDITSLPWDSYFNKDLIDALDNFQSIYNKHDVIAFLYFVSAAYAHYCELNVPALQIKGKSRKDLDAHVIEAYPKLYFHLKDIADQLN